MCLNYTCIFFFNFRLHVLHVQFCCFASATVAHRIIVLLNLNCGVILFINKEMVSLFQLYTYKFGLVYIA